MHIMNTLKLEEGALNINMNALKMLIKSKNKNSEGGSGEVLKINMNTLNC